MACVLGCGASEAFVPDCGVGVTSVLGCGICVASVLGSGVGVVSVLVTTWVYLNIAIKMPKEVAPSEEKSGLLK